MRREFLEALELEGGNKLPSSAVEAIMAEFGKYKTRTDNAITALTTERDGLKNQLGEAEKAIQSYKDMDVEGIKASVKQWEDKYNADTQALKGQLEAANYGFAVKEAASGLKFTSEGAKKAFLSDLTAKKLPVQEGKLLGMEDFIKAYKETDPGAFVPEGADEDPPIFARGGGGGGPTAADAALRSAFGLSNNMKKE